MDELTVNNGQVRVIRALHEGSLEGRNEVFIYDTSFMALAMNGALEMEFANGYGLAQATFETAPLVLALTRMCTEGRLSIETDGRVGFESGAFATEEAVPLAEFVTELEEACAGCDGPRFLLALREICAAANQRLLAEKTDQAA